MTDTNRRLVLAARPSGMVDAATTRLEEAPVPDLGPGEALVRVRYLSIDPTIRTWMDDRPGYLPPIGLGEVVRGGGLGEVVASASDHYAVGDTVFGMTGWQDYAVADDGEHAMRVVPAGVAPEIVLNVLGVTGMTAYFGLLDVGRLQPGETVVVSGAAGATGSVVGQIAKAQGAAKVVGIAGTPEKCAWIVDELGFDAAVDYKRDDVARRLRQELPGGIDVYFDNVGGPILDTCLAQLAMRGRVVLCGGISVYNAETPQPGPSNYLNLIVKRGRMEGFLVLDYLDRFTEAQTDMIGWVAEGKVKSAEHVVEGLEHTPDALNLLFTGGNTGKVLVRL
ncbi:MAG TPA: NADP-dependent oxidoreductase [Acidimicrobiales bacterium]|nr:NADP-dependent oxidoreductase [Acidimicrobiales bacterium]